MCKMYAYVLYSELLKGLQQCMRVINGSALLLKIWACWHKMKRAGDIMKDIEYIKQTPLVCEWWQDHCNSSLLKSSIDNSITN